MAVTVSGMFGSDKTYFADSPVVIDISGLEWPAASPFDIVRVEVIYPMPEDSGSSGGATEDAGYNVVGSFPADTGGQTSVSFDISSALRAIWYGYPFGDEVAKAQSALSGSSAQACQRAMRQYGLRISTEYMSDDGVPTVTMCKDAQGRTLIPGGQCLIGGMTEWERSLVADDRRRDVSALEQTGVRYGDASTKPVSSPERVGKDSITSWVDVQQRYTKSIFYPAPAAASLPGITGDGDDVPGSQTGWTGHAPLVLRDSMPYTDFLFVNRRGAVETCSAQMLEAQSIEVETKQYARIERPSFRPTRTLTAVASGGRRSWAMSSGHQDREWAEWWTMEFLMARQWWMLYRGAWVPVTVEPEKKSTGIYDRAKQQMPSVEFTVTLALEG